MYIKDKKRKRRRVVLPSIKYSFANFPTSQEQLNIFGLVLSNIIFKWQKYHPPGHCIVDAQNQITYTW